MKVIFYDPIGSKVSEDLVRGLLAQGMKAESAYEMGYEDPEEVTMLLRDGSEGEEYDALVCVPDGSEIINYIARVLRHDGVKIPFIFLTTADAGQRIEFLKQGASCCLPNPVLVEELAAVIHAQHNLFRQGIAEQVIHVGNVIIDMARKRVSVAREHEGIFHVHFTNKEYLILEALAKNVGRSLTKEQLMNNLYLLDAPELKIIDVFICKVRKKIENAGGDRVIHTVWGQGYRMDEASEEVEELAAS